jgi:hypothetical protein
MSKGKASLYLEGGPLDKDILEDIDARHIQEKIRFPTLTWGRKVDGNIEIIKGGKLDKFWNFTAQDVYEKTLRRNGELIVYSFLETETVDRCSAITKSGNQCMKSARIGKDTCETHQ